MDSAQALAPTRQRQKAVSRTHNNKWSQEDDALLQRLMLTEPTENFASLLSYFPGKTATQIGERWSKVLDPKLIKGSWTREEDEIIIKFVNEHGTKNWKKLADILPGRLGKQCRERWRNHLDPNVNRSPWTAEEDALLIQLHEKYGNQWVKISEMFNGRSDNCVKNRWNSTLKKQLYYDKLGIQRPKRGRPSLQKTPKSADDIPKPPKLEEIAAQIQAIEPKPASTPTLTPSLQTPLFSPFLKSPFQQASPSMEKEILPISMSPSLRDDQFSFSPNMLFNGFSLFSPRPTGNQNNNISL